MSNNVNVSVNVNVENSKHYRDCRSAMNMQNAYPLSQRSTFTRFAMSLWNTAVVLLCCWLTIHLYMNHIAADTEAFEAKYLDAIKPYLDSIKSMIESIDVESLKLFAKAIAFVVVVIAFFVLAFVLLGYPLFVAVIVYNMLALGKGDFRIWWSPKSY